MAERSAGSIRARVRAEITEEIKAAARRRLATDGADLSLRAVARDLGMVSSAVYRYFASRDDLLTALIIDAYDAMGRAAEEADAAHADRTDAPGRWLAVARAIRAWALARPAEYALTYGSPVPGYAAPRDTVGPATRTTAVLGRILVDAYAAGRVDPEAGPDTPLPPPLHDEVHRIAELVAPGVPEPVVARGLVAWTELFGAISFELFGRFDNTIDARDEWFDHQTRMMIAFLGLR
ncbi:MAG TPA: TetR/AcrR family transcriptional regulator [Pseudonocardiaceae bacterium]